MFHPSKVLVKKKYKDQTWVEPVDYGDLNASSYSETKEGNLQRMDAFTREAENTDQAG